MGKLNGFTIIESLVAMIVLCITITISFVIYNNVLSFQLLNSKMQASVICEELAKSTIREKTYFDEEIDDTNGFVRKTLNSYKSSNSIYVLECSYINFKGDTVSAYRELVNIKE